MKHAAVALVMAGRGRTLSLCFIRRATHPKDPWSGQMALPGGRASADDPNPWSVAVRETREEVGLSLERSHDLGALSEMHIGRHRQRNLGVLSPFVFHVGETLPPLVPEASEVGAAYWIPVQHLWDGANQDNVAWDGNQWPGIRYRGEIIWGLTLRVLHSFARVIDYPLP